MSWPEQGIHQGVPFADYRACDITPADTLETATGKSVSKSLIVDFIPDPWAWKKSGKKKQTKAMKGGSLFDCLLTEPETFDERFIVSEYDEFRTKESKAWRDEQEQAGLMVVKDDELTKAKEQLAAVMSHKDAAKLIFGSRKQVAFRHKTKYPFWNKGLIDLLPEEAEVIADIKTCEPSALESKRSLQRHIFDWGYHIQAGAYCQGYGIASGEERIRFKFIFVASVAPLRVAVIELPLAAILFGADIYREGMRRFAECLETNRWPSIWDGTVNLDLPAYAYLETEEGQ